jgi:hypothetical protein
MTISKAKADKCVSHHCACDCREYRMQEMESALKVIETWADVWSEGGMSDDTRKHCMRQIRDKARDGLGMAPKGN